MDARKLALGLGWFSIGLGAAELIAPGSIARFLGIRGGHGVLRAYGAREIATGVGILAQPQQPAWLWGRVAGDLLDLGTLGAARQRKGAPLDRLGIAAGAVAGALALDALCATRLQREAY